MMKGLMAAMPDEGEEASASEPSATSTEDEFLDDAFDAAGKDRKAFRSAMKSAIRACMKKEDAGEYTEE